MSENKTTWVDLIPIGLKYRNILYLPPASLVYSNNQISSDSIDEVVKFGVNLRSIGFRLHPDDLKTLVWTSNADYDYEKAFHAVAVYAGLDHPYHTFYDGVYADSIGEERSYFNALIHYTSEKLHGDIANLHRIGEGATYDALEGLNFDHLEAFIENAEKYEGNVTTIELYRAPNFFGEIAKGFLSSNTPLSETQQEELITILDYVYKNQFNIFESFIPTTIPCKETLAKLVVESIKHEWHILQCIHLNNPTDVLRLFAVYSDSDGSLTRPPRFKNHLSANERKTFLTLLATFSNEKEKLFQSFQTYPEYWKRALERLKPERYHTEPYVTLNEVVATFRKKDKENMPKTPNAICEHWLKLVREGNINTYQQGLNAIKQFPGSFIRYFDAYVRAYGNRINDDEWANRHFQYITLEALHEVLPKVESTQMLLRVALEYSTRVMNAQREEKRLRYVRTKLSSKLISIPEQTKLCNEKYEKAFLWRIYKAFMSELDSRFHKQRYLGNVYIDPVANGIVAPTQLRHVSDGRIVLPSQSSFHLTDFVNMEKVDPEKNQLVYVPFIHWTNQENGRRVDIDLSAYFLDEEFNVIDHCFYGHLSAYTKDKELYAVHSGDFVDGGTYGGDGVSEFLLVRKTSAQKAGARYVIITCHDFTGQGFCNNPVHFGFQVMVEDMSKKPTETLHEHRNDGKLSPVIKPEQIIATSDFASKESGVFACLIDLQTDELIYADTAVSVVPKQISHKNSTHMSELAKGDISYKDYINMGGNNVYATEASAISTLKGLLDRPKLTCADLLRIHANTRGNLVDNPEMADCILTLPNTQLYADAKPDQRVLTPFMTDVWLSEFLGIKK